jgi:glycosyltransferase involved in cell wall biosynthesis
LDFSPFRTLEYGHYLNFFNAILLSLEGWHTNISNETFAGALAGFPVEASVRSRIRRFQDGNEMSGRLAYVTFLHNAAALLPYFTQRGLPFVLQLYPGGGFDLGQAATDEKLRHVLLSPLCRKVIVTQTISRDYVIGRIGCDPAKVEFIYGGVFDSRVDFDFFKDKPLFGRDKDTLDLCFVAHRYGDNLAAKGFDHFVAVARALAADDPRPRFHVVGDYSADDLPLGDATARFTFHGRRPVEFFKTFYPRMDAILSVTRPFAQGPGAFDGFPTGACMEAGFRGVLNCINDPLNLNVAFEDGRDLVLLDDEPAHAVARLRDLFAAPSRLHDLAYANWRKFREVFDVNQQLWARTRIIANELMRSEALIVRPRPAPSGLDGNTDNIVSYLVDQCRNQADWARDTERRHIRLIELYRERERQLGQLIEDDAVTAVETREATEAVADTAPEGQVHPLWRLRYYRLRARIGRSLHPVWRQRYHTLRARFARPLP